MWWVDPITTVIVSVFGFGGVIATIRSNGTQAIKTIEANGKQARDLETARDDRRASQLSEALYAELRLVVDVLRNGSERDSEKDWSEDNEDIFIPKLDLSPIYRACASSFPDLPAEDISRIIKCHGLLQTHQGKLSMLYSLNDSGSHFLVPLTSRVMHHKMTKSHADGIDKILRTAGK
jgi:hypothetical protein